MDGFRTKTEMLLMAVGSFFFWRQWCNFNKLYIMYRYGWFWRNHHMQV